MDGSNSEESGLPVLIHSYFVLQNFAMHSFTLFFALHQRQINIIASGHRTYNIDVWRSLFTVQEVLNRTLSATAVKSCPFCPGMTESQTHFIVTCPQYDAGWATLWEKL